MDFQIKKIPLVVHQGALGGADGGTLVVKYFDRAAHCKVNLLVYVF
jgi:hypothetical protein